MAVGLVSKDLVTEGDGVVVEASGEVPLCGAFIVVHGTVHITDTPVQVADTIVQRQVGVLARQLVGLDGKLVGLDGALPVLALLELSGPLPVTGGVAHSASSVVGGVLSPVAGPGKEPRPSQVSAGHTTQNTQQYRLFGTPGGQVALGDRDSCFGKKTWPQ